VVPQARALQLWTAGSQRGAFAAWRTLTQHRKAVIDRLSASAAANTRSSTFKVLPADWAEQTHVLGKKNLLPKHASSR
jgi:hypothetical protein